jgi:hypothetical protein
VLLGAGYASTLSPAGEELHLRRSYWLGFLHPSGAFKVDLHWKLADPFFRYEPDVETLWANARTVVLGGAPVATFAPEDTVLVLAAHGFKHAYSRLKWICDLCEWIRVHPELDWTAVRATARSLHVERILAVSLGLVHAFDDAVLPDDVVRAVAGDAKVPPLIRRVWGVLFHGDPEIAGVAAAWFQARGRERRRDAWSYLRQQAVRRCKRAVVPNEKDRALLPLPRGLGFLHYGVRPARLAARFVTGRGPEK